MAKVDNPRKQFQFQVYIPGMNPFLVQQLKESDDELDQVEHGDTGHLIKTAGMRKLSNITLDKICPTIPIDEVAIAAWFIGIRNFKNGGGLLPSQYKKPIIIEELASDGITVIERKIYNGCWPQKRNGKEFSRTKSDNTTQSLEFSVDTVI